ncbi:N-formylglutamate amidohydrolase [Parapedobacter tibetensis]|uniref:N-formylglutamate amidohydrolase n=1 Tax=Parapedobacter tibetensis TaxID=2972951 RepID=UPI00214DAEC1|nr:N-formylglutamate amidohydrolase [Parapedobacter tibetensis]
MELSFSIHKAQSPIIAAAIHDGHLIDASLLDDLALQEHERFREEDPYTAYMADLPVSRIDVRTSRFQIDLNRAREQAIYRRPEDAWGLQVWRRPLPKTSILQLLDEYDRFYTGVAQLLQWTIAMFGKFVVLDIHSYNHRRSNPLEAASISENPEINIGTAFNYGKWQLLGRRVVRFLSYHSILGHFPDVRENTKFGGGTFAEWVNRYYGEYGCVLSLEFKKTFMDEWTGRVDIRHLNDIRMALKGCIPFLLDQLDVQSKLT